MNEQVDQVYEFGPFRVEVAKYRLLRDGLPIHLKPKVFDLLLALVRNRGQMLTKDDLMRQLWPDSFVEENNLAVSIFALRRALGERPDKHIYVETIPRRGYRFAADVKDIRTEVSSAGENVRPDSNPGQTASAGAVAKSIAVLPLECIGKGAGDEGLGLGLAEALITRLGNLRRICVRPTSTVRAYTSGKHEPTEVGRALGVDFVLEGTIRRAGTRVRVTMQLVVVPDGVTLWAEKFDEELKDAFVVEDSISRQVAGALTLKLSGAAPSQARRSASAEAYRAYMKGRFFWNQRSRKGLEKSIEYFEQVIKLDADYALPYVGLADAYIQMANQNLLPPKEAYVKAKDQLLEALRLDNDLIEARATLAILRVLTDWDWDVAEEEFKQAMQSDASYVKVHQWFAVYLRHMGRFDEALAEIEKAQELDPVSPGISTTRGLILHFARRYDEAIEELERAFELDMNYPIALFAFGLVYTQQGRYEEAIAALKKVRTALGDGDPEVAANLAYIYALSGRTAEARALLDELLERADTEYISHYHIAIIYTALGQVNQAFAFLERAYQSREPDLCLLKIDPHLDALRADSRLLSLLQRLGLMREDDNLSGVAA